MNVDSAWGERLDILRVDVLAANDDHVLEPPADVQLAVVQKADVAGAQKRFPMLGVADQPGPEGRAAGLGLCQSPIARPSPATQISPVRPAPHSMPVSGSTMRMSALPSARPQLISGRAWFTRLVSVITLTWPWAR